MMKKLLPLLFLIAPLFCEAQIFKGGIVAGMNFSQVDGDGTGGYRKLGINSGFVGQIDLTDRWYLNVEILFSQKGSKGNPNNFEDFKLVLDYADVPILIKYHDKKGGMNFGAGVAIGRIVRSKYELFGAPGPDSFFSGDGELRKWNAEGIADLSYMITPVWGLNLRFSYSIVPFRKDALSQFRNMGQFNHFVSFRTIFLFSALGKKDD